MSLCDIIYALEFSLLTDEVRRSVDALDSVLHDNFIELGASGNIYNKSATLQSLPGMPQQIFVMDDFKVMHLSDELQLATYRLSSDNKNISLRSSIWKKSGNNWQMVFHQGTRIAKK